MASTMAIVSDAAAFLSHNIPGILLLILVAHFTRNYFRPGVSDVPGPFLAKLSNIWRFIDVAKGHAEKTLYQLHEQYGDYVRLGPNVVSIRNLDALKTVYGINNGYQKVRQRGTARRVGVSIDKCYRPTSTRCNSS